MAAPSFFKLVEVDGMLQALDHHVMYAAHFPMCYGTVLISHVI